MIWKAWFDIDAAKVQKKLDLHYNILKLFVTLHLISY
jgi:hypothetical protein